MSVFPAKIQDITPELLTSLLSKKYPGVVVNRVTIIEHAECGDGLASTADRVCLSLDFAEGKSFDVPRQMMLKTIFLHPWFRFGMPMILGTAKFVNLLERLPLLGKLSGPFIFTLINIYQRYFPHAPEAMYRNEVNFYSMVRDNINIEAPEVYAAVIDDKNGQFGILMEDLRLRDAKFPSAVDGVTVEQMKSLVVNLAHLHASYWQSEKLDNEFSWLPKTFEGGMYPVFDAIGLNVIKDQVAKNKFKQDLLAPFGKSVEELWDAMWKSQHLIYQQPLTLLHGDTHIGNTYVMDDGDCGMLDWQLMVKGPWCQDITYMMITGLSVEDRRNHEMEILKLYIDTLKDLGVPTPPSEQEAFYLYRQTAIWGLVIGWLITPPQNYGEEITAANISKMCTAMLDLDTLGSLGY